MTRSRHTEPPKIIAASGVKRRPDGSVVPPRVVYRKPRRGDRHPVSKGMLQALLLAIPLEYTAEIARAMGRKQPRNGSC